MNVANMNLITTTQMNQKVNSMVNLMETNQRSFEDFLLLNQGTSNSDQVQGDLIADLGDKVTTVLNSIKKLIDFYHSSSNEELPQEFVDQRQTLISLTNYMEKIDGRVMVSSEKSLTDQETLPISDIIKELDLLEFLKRLQKLLEMQYESSAYRSKPFLIREQHLRMDKTQLSKFPSDTTPIDSNTDPEYKEKIDVINDVRIQLENLLSSMENNSNASQVFTHLLELVYQWKKLEEIGTQSEEINKVLEIGREEWIKLFENLEKSTIIHSKEDDLIYKGIDGGSHREQKGKVGEVDAISFVNLTSYPLMKNSVNELENDISVRNQTMFNEIIAKTETLLSKIANNEDISKISPKILELLKQLSELQKRGNTLNLDETNRQLTKEQRIFTDIFQSFQRRDHSQVKQPYQMNSDVTIHEMKKWLEKAFENNGFYEKQPIQSLQSGVALSKMEQYVIHINPVNDTKPMNQELLRQFQSVLESSKFLTKPNGMKQLSILIKPDNLGEMRIRLLQINGEMTVKILVSTQAAKEMLETNMSQLRHMFAPHQVSIEKQELQMQQGSLVDQDDSSNEWKEESEQSNQSEQEGKSSSEDESELSFNELLMNLKV